MQFNDFHRVTHVMIPFKKGEALVRNTLKNTAVPYTHMIYIPDGLVISYSVDV